MYKIPREFNVRTIVDLHTTEQSIERILCFPYNIAPGRKLLFIICHRWSVEMLTGFKVNAVVVFQTTKRPIFMGIIAPGRDQFFDLFVIYHTRSRETLEDSKLPQFWRFIRRNNLQKFFFNFPIISRQQVIHFLAF